MPRSRWWFGARRTENQGSHHQGKHGSRFFGAEGIARTLANPVDLGVHEPAYPGKQRRRTDRFGQHADPTPRGNDVRRIVELYRGQSVGVERSRLGIERFDAASEASYKVLDPR